MMHTETAYLATTISNVDLLEEVSDTGCEVGRGNLKDLDSMQSRSMQGRSMQSPTHYMPNPVFSAPAWEPSSHPSQIQRRDYRFNRQYLQC